MFSCKPIYEFLVWDNCNNNCKFCFQRNNPNILTLEEQKNSLNKVLEFIDSSKFIKNSHVLIVGGEIFYINNDFLNSFFKKIVANMLSNKIDLLYLNTNLLYKNLSNLFYILDLIKEYELFHRLKFTTSFDLDGRFKSENDKQLMLNNLLLLSNKYLNDGLNIVTNIILTKKVCDSILNNTFNVIDFMIKYNTYVNLLPYIVYDKTLSVEKNKIFKTLEKVNEIAKNTKYENYLESYIKNFDLPQKKELYHYNKVLKNFDYCSCELNTCGHSINFNKYTEENTCFVCDLKKYFYKTKA